jgi:hypothetical protein
MRTVFCHLTGCSQADVARVLDASFVAQGSGAPWIVVSDWGDAILYIHIYENFRAEVGEHGFRAIEAALGGEVQVSVAADVSGRHDGTTEATAFVLALLSKFRGVATDDFSDHPWTRIAIEQKAALDDGQRFFAFRRP